MNYENRPELNQTPDELIEKEAINMMLPILDELRRKVSQADEVNQSINNVGAIVDTTKIIQSEIEDYIESLRSYQQEKKEQAQPKQTRTTIKQKEQVSLREKIDQKVINLGEGVGRRIDNISEFIQAGIESYKNRSNNQTSRSKPRHAAIGPLAVSGALAISLLQPKPALANEEGGEKLKTPENEVATQGTVKIKLPPAENNESSKKKRYIGKHRANSPNQLVVNLESEETPPAESNADEPSEGKQELLLQPRAKETKAKSKSQDDSGESLKVSLHNNNSLSLQEHDGYKAIDVPEPDAESLNDIVEDSFKPDANPVNESLDQEADAPTKDLEVQTVLINQGDTLSKLAKEHGSSVSELAQINQIDNPDLIYAGDELRVPKNNEVIGAEPLESNDNNHLEPNQKTVESNINTDNSDHFLGKPQEESRGPEASTKNLNESLDTTIESEDITLKDTQPANQAEETPQIDTETQVEVNQQKPEQQASLESKTKPTPEKTRSIKQVLTDFISHPNIEIRDDLDMDELLEAIDNNGMTWAEKCSSDPGRIHVSINPAVFELILLAADSGESIQVLDVASSDAHSCSSLHAQGANQISALDLAYSESLYLFFDQSIKNENPFRINELIYANPPAGTNTYDKGRPHKFSKPIVQSHQEHIHIGLDPVNSVETPGIVDKVEKQEQDRQQLVELINNIDQDYFGTSAERLQHVLVLLVDYGAKNNLKLTPQGLAAYAAHGISESNFKNDAVGDNGAAKGWFQYQGERQSGMGLSDQEQIEHSIIDMQRDSKQMKDYDMLAAIQNPNLSLEQVVTEGYEWLRPRAYLDGKERPELGYRWKLAQDIYNDMQS